MLMKNHQKGASFKSCKKKVDFFLFQMYLFS